MTPTLRDGELVLIDPDAVVGVGDIVVADHPHKPIQVVKRVTSVDAEGRLVLWSPRGSHSASFGPVLPSAVHGRVTVSLTRRVALVPELVPVRSRQD
jgi:hypothetical protein